MSPPGNTPRESRDQHLGQDLMVVPHFAAHAAAEIDLTTRATRARGAATIGRVGLQLGEATDLATFAGRENLAQALILRLLTARGSLTALGHPDYGSRLHELIGRRKESSARHQCRAFVLEVVAQEPRVEDRAVGFAFEPERESLDSLVFTLAVAPKADPDTTLSLSIEVGL